MDVGVDGGFLSSVFVFLCRSSYFVNLLGLKIPLGLLVRASRARHAFAFLLIGVMPFFIYCHLSLLPSVRNSEQGALVWQVLLAMWITIPTTVVGVVILARVQAVKPCLAFFVVLSAEICFHFYGVQFLQPTALGTTSLQIMFVYFEDLPVLAWLWCLYHVVKIQNHVKAHAAEAPIAEPQGPDDRVLIVGNAPTVTDGSPLGEEIDRFAHVARFNSYTVSKPAFTGSRTDFHFCNGRQVASGKRMKVVLPLFNASLTHAAYLFFPHMEDARRITDNLTSDKATAWVVDEPRLLALMKKLGIAFWQVPTSGMVAIDAFLSKHPSVSLHGFNFFQGKKIHYFEESATQLITSWLERFVTHDPSKEKLWVASLVKDGHASFLAETAAPNKVGETTDTKSKTSDKENQARQRPSLMRTILKDGVPSQFSI